MARLRSRSETMPTSASSSTTGRWRMPRCWTRRSAAGSDCFGVIVITAARITCSTSVVVLLASARSRGSGAPLPLGPIERHGHGRLSEDRLGDTSEQGAPDAASSPGRHRDQVGVPGFGLVQDLLARVAVSHGALERDSLEAYRGRVQIVQPLGFEARRLLIGVHEDAGAVAQEAS